MRWSGRRGSCTLLIHAAGVLCIVAASGSPARASDVDDVLDVLRVQPGATCLEAEQLAAQVVQHVGEDGIPDEMVISVKGSAIDPRGVRLSVLREERTVAYRTFEPGPASCHALHAAVGLAIALALKVSHQEEEVQEPAAADADARARQWSLSAAALGSYRLLPEVAPGLALSVRHDLGEHMALRLGGMGLLAFDVGLPLESGGFDATLVLGRADACASGRLAEGVRAGVCAGLLGGVLHAAGQGLDRIDSANVPVFALGSAAGLEAQLSSHWSLEFELSMVVLLQGVRVGTRDDRSGAPAASRALPSPGFAAGIGPVYHFL